MVLEHRSFGLSSEKSLMVHTPENAVDDLAYFASNVNLPFPDDWLHGSSVGPDKNPLDTHRRELRLCIDKLDNGCSSYGFLCRMIPFWRSTGCHLLLGLLEPIRQNMPGNCSAKIQQVTGYIDSNGT